VYECVYEWVNIHDGTVHNHVPPPCPLSSLQTFLLDGNCLSELPEDLGSLRKLGYLGLSFNQFSHVPQVLERLASMERLCMAGNSLDTLVLQNFRLLRVKHVDLR